MFLIGAYWLSQDDGLSLISFEEVIDYLNYEQTEYEAIEDFLTVQGYIKRQTAGGIQGRFRLIIDGIVEVERIATNGHIKMNSIRVDDDGSEENSEIDLAEVVSQKQEKREAFLLLLFEETQGSPNKMVQIRDIAEKMGIEEREACVIEHYLSNVYLLERVSMGGWNGSISLTEWGAQQIYEALLTEDDENTKQQRGPNLDTTWKLEELRKLRAEYLSPESVNIGWMIACERVGIRPETVKAHDPELRKRWDDPAYRPV